MRVTAALLTALVAGANGLTEYVKNNVRTNMGENRVVSIKAEHLTAKVQDLLEFHGADLYGTHDKEAHFSLSPEALLAIQEAELSFEDKTEHWINHFEENFKDPNFFCTANDCHERDMQSFYSSYQTLPAIHSRAQSLAAANPTLATMGTVGLSYQGRDMLTMNIGDVTKPLVYYQCNIHAREWLTPMFCIYMAENLLANGGHPLLDTYSFTILFSANPDGYIYSYTTNSQWRKTRKPNSGSSCVGTDGNRNYPVSHCGSGASTSKCSETYCGASPFDQPETANVAAFAALNADRLIAINDVHAYGQLWMCPWAYTEALPPAADFAKMQTCNAAAAAGIKSVNGLTFEYGPVATTIYLAAGGAVDYFYDEYNVIYAYTAEVRGNSFQPSASNILPSNMEMFAGMVSSLECIKEEELTTPEPTIVGAPTSFPTKFPTVGCADSVPSGIVYSGSGAPAPCNEIGIYCSAYDFVREACPKTCGTCGTVQFKVSTEPKVVPAFHAEYVVAPIVAAFIAGVAALVVVRRRMNTQTEESGEAAKGNATGEVDKKMDAWEQQEQVKKEVAQEVVPVPAPTGKDAPKDMYDV